MNDFSFELEQIEDRKTWVVKLQGRWVDESTGSGMIEELDKLVKRGHSNFIFDMEKLEYLNSSGLNTLVNQLTKSRSVGGDVVLTNLSEKVKNLFIVTKLNTVFTVAESQQEALENF